MAFTIGAGMALDGEKEFKSAISGINKDISVLASEMGKVTAQFGSNADSMDSLRAKSEVYNKQIDEQKKKIETLKAALQNSAKEYGETDTKTKNWQISLNKAEAELAKTEGALKDTTSKINNFGKESNQTGDQVEKAGKQASGSGDDAKKGWDGWDKLGSGLAKAGEMAGKAILALGTAAVTAATAVGAMTVKSAYAADEINTLSKQTGLSTEQIQKFQFASEQIDVSMETLTGSMAKLTRNMLTAQNGTGTASEAFKALGISITNADGTLRSNQDVFNEAINALGKMENETQRDAFAMAIFGKSAQDLNPLNLGGADALKKLGDEAAAAGLILDQTRLDNLNALADAIDTFKATVSGSGNLLSTAFAGPMATAVNTVTGYIQQLAQAFNEGGWDGLSDKFGEVLADLINKAVDALPKIVDMGINIIDKIVEGLTKNMPAIASGATKIILALTKALIELLPQLLQMGIQVITQVTQGIAEALPELIPAAVAAINQLVNTFIENLPIFIDAALQIIVALANGLAQSLPELIPSVVDAVITIVETLIDNIDMLIDAAIAIIMALAEGIIDALPRLIEKVPEIIIKLIAAIIENAPKLIEAAIQIIVQLANGIIASLGGLWDACKQIIDKIGGFISDLWEDIKNIGKNIIEGIWEGIKNAADWLADQISGFFEGVIDGVKDFLGISSPSKVFAGIGEYMAQGLGKGFVNQMAQVSKDIANSIPASAGDIDVGINRVYGSSGKLGGVVVNLTNNFYNYKPRDGAAAARDLNRQLGLAYTI